MRIIFLILPRLNISLWLLFSIYTYSCSMWAIIAGFSPTLSCISWCAIMILRRIWFGRQVTLLNIYDWISSVVIALKTKGLQICETHGLIDILLIEWLTLIKSESIGCCFLRNICNAFNLECKFLTLLNN